MSGLDSSSVFIEPLDMLVLRGNRLFADAATHGEALMPPWPSVPAGSLRSRMLVDAGADLKAFAAGGGLADPQLAAVLGTPAEPGSFRLRHFSLARRLGASVQALFGLPADLLPTGDGQWVCAQPRPLPDAVYSSYPLSALPMLATAQAVKQDRARWLTPSGFQAWMEGRAVPDSELVASRDLWSLDARLGIGTNTRTATVNEGALYTTEGVVLRPGVGFTAVVQGAADRLPHSGLLRFGGDGRGAALQRMDNPLPEPDWDDIARNGRFRLLLTTPGIFPDGWRLPCLQGDRWQCEGLRARLVSAAVDRLQTLSGWDLARKAPKPAVRAVPAGAVYWFGSLEGDIAGLASLMRQGLPLADASRRAEGFNNCLVAPWPGHSSSPGRAN
jgi:CRISPR-associated protein Cmr3